MKTFSNGNKGWIGVDLDGTFAHYDHWRGPGHIGAPIPLMLTRIRTWLEEGQEVCIFTARVTGGEDAMDQDEIAVARATIEAYCLEHLGQALPITATKDYRMIELWDDRAIQVIPNTGQTIADELASVRSALEGKP